jgi:bis(5'-nucleosidyl)-tetraphosphatase
MRVEKSVAMIVFRKEEDFRFLLLYKQASEHYKEAWEFPKGNQNIQKNETEMQTAIRELAEETGLQEKDLEFLDFHDKISFFYRDEAQELIRKEVSFLMARTTRSEIKISSEHNAYRWAPYLEAFDLLSQKNNKEILRKSYDFLKKFFRQKTIF